MNRESTLYSAFYPLFTRNYGNARLFTKQENEQNDNLLAIDCVLINEQIDLYNYGRKKMGKQ